MAIFPAEKPPFFSLASTDILERGIKGESEVGRPQMFQKASSGCVRVGASCGGENGWGR